jgi:outer membrane protein
MITLFFDGKEQMSMTKKLLLCVLLFGITFQVYAANLLDVYQQALVSDTIYHQAIATQLATGENVPINRAMLLPNASFAISPSVTKQLASGPAAYTGSNTVRELSLGLTITQTVFNFAQFAALAGAKASAKQAEATLNSAAQNLIIRVAQAYFQVLQDEDNLSSNLSSETAYEKQLDQATQEYKVGLKTITDVYTAQASYQTSVASYINAKNQLAIDRENLRVITGVLYPNLAKLSEKLPLITPQPTNMDAWVKTSQQQNWAVKAAQYGVEVAHQNIKQQFAGHLPTLSATGSYNISHTQNIGGSAILDNSGTGQTHTSAFGLTLGIPLFEGGQVVAQTDQAKYQYELAAQQLEQQLRNTMNQARQSYLSVTAGISAIEADRKAIKSARSSYEGLEAGYEVGTQTLVDVLNQQQKLLQAELQYATDRYAYVNNLLALKQAAGTLSPQDLVALNTWLESGIASIETPKLPSSKHHHVKKYSHKKIPAKHLAKKKVAVKKLLVHAKTKHHAHPV